MSATSTPKQINKFVIAVAEIEDATIAVKIKQAFCAIQIPEIGALPASHNKINTIFFKNGYLAG